MTFTALLPQAVTIVRVIAGAENEYGNPILADSTLTVVNARLEQLGSRERTLEQQTTVDRWRAFLPYGTDIRAGDELIESGRRFRVDGTPEVVYGATSPHHIEASLIYAADVDFSAAESLNVYDTAVYDSAVYA